jgi:hypothetical protein
MLTDLALKVERIIFVGIPTKRISNDDWAAAYNARNAIMKVGPSLLALFKLEATADPAVVSF